MATQVTLKMLTEHLEKFGWKQYQAQKELGEKEGLISTGWRSSAGRTYDMTIDPIEERGCLSFKVRRIVLAPWEKTPPGPLADLLLLLAWVNYDMILGKFCYDIRNGEVHLSVDVPTDENTFNYNQFEHTMHVLLNASEKWEAHFLALLHGEKSLGEIILDKARESNAAEEYVKQLEGALQRRDEALQGKEGLLTEV